ncbi:DNA methyltransferase [Spirochaetia bacterium]|nr:DNA methyltransferase [Spirochaetia bacterium]
MRTVDQMVKTSRGGMIQHPLCRYHGSKWRVASWVISHFPQHRIYLEPFGGSASVLLRKARCEVEIYNDLDGELVNLLRVTRDQGAALAEKIYMTPYAREEFVQAFEPADDKVEQARRTFIRAFMGFGGGYISHSSKCARAENGFRSSWKIHGNHANLDWLKLPDNLLLIMDRLRGVVLENLDYRELIKRNDSPGTLVYADPPYVAETRDRGTDYKHEFSESDHVELAKVLHECQGPVVISGYHSELYNDLYHDWRVSEKATRTMQNSPGPKCSG